jgi:hypothetical protein
MRKLFGAMVMAGALASGSAQAACTQPQDQQFAANKDAMQRAILVAAMSCGDASLGTRAVFYRAGEPQQTDAAVLAFVLLLQAQRSDDPPKKVLP